MDSKQQPHQQQQSVSRLQFWSFLRASKQAKAPVSAASEGARYLRRRCRRRHCRHCYQLECYSLRLQLQSSTTTVSSSLLRRQNSGPIVICLQLCFTISRAADTVLWRKSSKWFLQCSFSVGDVYIYIEWWCYIGEKNILFLVAQTWKIARLWLKVVAISALSWLVRHFISHWGAIKRRLKRTMVTDKIKVAVRVRPFSKRGKISLSNCIKCILKQY